MPSVVAYLSQRTERAQARSLRGRVTEAVSVWKFKLSINISGKWVVVLPRFGRLCGVLESRRAESHSLDHRAFQQLSQ
jgi:hypothetical protein